MAKLDEQTKSRIVQLFNNKVQVHEIAKQLGISSDAVGEIVRCHSIGLL